MFSDNADHRFTHVLLIVIVMHLFHDLLWGWGGLPIVMLAGLWTTYYPRLRTAADGRRQRG